MLLVPYCICSEQDGHEFVMVSTANELRSGNDDAWSSLHHRTKQLSLQKVLLTIRSDICNIADIKLDMYVENLRAAISFSLNFSESQ